MSTSYDGSIVNPQQIGRRKESFPFDYLGNAYAKCIERRYQHAGTAYTGPAVTNRNSVMNNLTYSEELDNAAWTKAETTITASATANPRDGTTDADRINESTANAQHFISQVAAYVAGEYTFSVFAKPFNRDWIQINAYDGTDSHFVRFDITNGTVGTESGATGVMYAVGNGWYLLVIRFAAVVGTGAVIIQTMQDSSTTTYAGTTTCGCYAWGAQLMATASTLSNGGFETAGGGGGDAFGSWNEAVVGSSTITRDTGIFHSGAASCKMAVDSSNSDAVVQQTVLTIGTRYRVSFWARNDAGGTAGARVNIGGGTSQTTGALTTSFALFTFEATATSTQILTIGRQEAASQSVYIDDVSLTALDDVEIRQYGSPYIATTASTRSASAPDTDTTNENTNSDPFAFLCEETPPEDGLLDLGIVEFTRTYCRIPATQVEYTNKFFQRPVMDDVYVAASTAYAVSFDGGVTSHVFVNNRKTVSSVGTVTPGTTPITQAAEDPGALSSTDTFTITDSNGQTATPFFNTAVATMRSSILTSCTNITGLVITGDASTLNISWATNVRTIGTTSDEMVMSSASPTSVTFRARTPQVAADQTQTPNADPSTRTINATAHGGVAGDFVVLWNGNRIVARSKVVTASADSFTILLADFPGLNDTATHCGFSSDATACYVNGLKMCSIKRSHYFYLPGFTADVATGADIPNFTVYTDPVSWLGRIIAVPTGYAAIEVAELAYWRGPIQTQVVDEVQMADAIDTVTP